MTGPAAGAGGAVPGAGSATRVSPRTLIEACISAEGRAELDVVYDLGLALGLPEQTVRLALRRMQAEGILEQRGRGRSGHLVLTAQGELRAERERALVEFAFAQDRSDIPWDGCWRLYGFSVPEHHRAERDGLRRLLTLLGAAQLLPGVYATPHDLGSELRRSVAPATLDRYLIVSVSTDLRMPGCETPRDVAERLWPATEIDAAYERLAAEVHRRPAAAPTGPVAVAARALELVDALDAALLADPLLPSELLPEGWRPRRLRAEFEAEWTALREAEPELPVFAWAE